MGAVLGDFRARGRWQDKAPLAVLRGALGEARAPGAGHLAEEVVAQATEQLRWMEEIAGVTSRSSWTWRRT